VHAQRAKVRASAVGVRGKCCWCVWVLAAQEYERGGGVNDLHVQPPINAF